MPSHCVPPVSLHCPVLWILAKSPEKRRCHLSPVHDFINSEGQGSKVAH